MLRHFLEQSHLAVEREKKRENDSFVRRFFFKQTQYRSKKEKEKRSQKRFILIEKDDNRKVKIDASKFVDLSLPLNLFRFILERNSNEMYLQSRTLVILLEFIVHLSDSVVQ